MGAWLRPWPPAREGEAHYRAVYAAELLAQRAGVVGQAVAPADVAHARSNLRVAAGWQVRIQVVLDLEAEVAAEEVKQRAAVDVRRAQQLAHVEPAPGLARDLLLGEGVGLVGEVPAEDDRVRPRVADHVGGEVGRQRLLERAPREQREGDVVLHDLPARLDADRLQLLDHLRL